MALNFCSNCGAKLRTGAKFCGRCGEKIQSEENKLPPMPYEKPKSIEEIYAEKKSSVQVKPASPVKLEKTLPNVQADAASSPTNEIKNSAPKTMAEIFAEAKREHKTQTARENLIRTYTAAKESAPSPPAPQIRNSSPPQSTYNPPHDSTPHYKEDVTIKEKFFSTEGRLNRMRYFKRWLMIDIILLILIGIVSSNPKGDIMANLILIAAIIPEYCLNVRRIKDIGKDENFVNGIAGLEVVLTLAQIYCLSDWDWSSSKTSTQQFGFCVSTIRSGIFIWLQSTAGTVGANKYGADPLENERRFNQ